MSATVDRERSRGHIAWVPRASGGMFEYWAREGEIWRADSTAPVLPDGYRAGRWYGADRESTRLNLRASLDRWHRAREEHAPVRGADHDRETHDGCDICNKEN